MSKICVEKSAMRNSIKLLNEYKLYANKTKAEEIENLIKYLRQNHIGKEYLQYKYIITSSAHLYDVPAELIRTKTRKREVVEARQYAMWRIKQVSKLSLREIGLLFNGFDHATVKHACGVIETRKELNQLLFQKK